MNSDQGSQFTFFRSYKWEKLYLEEYDGYQLKHITREYMEYYNNVRPHESLGYKTPADYYNGYCSVKMVI